MKLRLFAASTTLVALSLVSSPLHALTMKQFVSLCKVSETDCADHPLLQAYVGGALDLIAALDEDTDYLAEVYCKPTKVLFDVPVIIRYMEGHQAEYADKNAMLLVIRYFEEQGGC